MEIVDGRRRTVDGGGHPIIFHFACMLNVNHITRNIRGLACK